MASIYDKSLMNAADVKRIDELEKAWRATQDAGRRKKLHESAEQIRRSYGYLGGEDGGGYEQLDGGVTGSASAARAYETALREAENARQAGYSADRAAADELLEKRLRDAYASRMRSTLGLDQQLRASGVTGGLSETTRAAYDNAYLKDRADAYSDAQTAKTALARAAAESAYAAGEKIAKLDYESALDRADRLTAADNERYSRASDAADRDLAERRFAYEQKRDSDELSYKKTRDAGERELELSKLEYAKQKDALDREYQKQKDQLEQAYKQQALAVASAKKTSSSSSRSSSSSSKDAAAERKLHEELVESAWRLLKTGVYDDRMPEVLGFSEDVLKEYAELSRYGY